MADSSLFSLERFHAGDRATLTRCYEEYFETVQNAVGTLLTGADKETVVHEIFLRLLSEDRFRQGFQGGSMAAWLRTIARNRAIDFRRRYYERERAWDPDGPESRKTDSAERPTAENQIDARLFVARLRQSIPQKLLPTFEARFVQGLSQREAADALGTTRTTLAYRETLVRRHLKKLIAPGEMQ